MPASKYIKIAMLENHMQQKELAERLGVSSASMSQMLRNDKMNYNRVEEIADILGYDIVWQKRQDNTSMSQQVNNNCVMQIGIQNNRTGKE